MAENKILLELGPAEVQVAVAEAEVFVGERPLLLVRRDRERQRLGRVEDVQVAHAHFDFARRQLRVDGLLGAVVHNAFHRDDVLTAQPLGLFVGGLVVLGREDDLREAVAVAEVDEDEATEVAPRIDPPLQDDLLADVGRLQFAAGVGARAVGVVGGYGWLFGHDRRRCETDV